MGRAIRSPPVIENVEIELLLARPGLQVIIGIACNVSNHIEPSAAANWRTIGPQGDWFIISSTIGKVGTSIGEVQA